jgi:hypothetical protein
LIKFIRIQNNLDNNDFLAFATEEMMIARMNNYTGQNVTRSALSFNITDNRQEYNEILINYKIFYNHSEHISLYDGLMYEPYVVPELQLSVDKAIAKVLKPNINTNIELQTVFIILKIETMA